MADRYKGGVRGRCYKQVWLMLSYLSRFAILTKESFILGGKLRGIVIYVQHFDRHNGSGYLAVVS